MDPRLRHCASAFICALDHRRRIRRDSNMAGVCHAIYLLERGHRRVARLEHLGGAAISRNTARQLLQQTKSYLPNFATHRHACRGRSFIFGGARRMATESLHVDHDLRGVGAAFKRLVPALSRRCQAQDKRHHSCPVPRVAQATWIQR